MKVVLFCGGRGMRIKESTDEIPKPMVTVGYRPILWHVMKYYAHFGHKDFILCLGHGGDLIKNYFVNYKEYVSNDFELRNGKSVDLQSRDIYDWSITFADTGENSNTAQRLINVRKYLEGEEMFFANYADGLTDLPLETVVERFKKSNSVGSFMAVKPTQSFHVASIDKENCVIEIQPFHELGGVWINVGYFIFRKEIFKYIHRGEELVEQPFQRLIDQKLLMVYPHRGTFFTMDTYKEMQILDDMHVSGNMPWQVWKR